MRHKTYFSAEQQWDRSVKMLASRRKFFVDAHRLGIDLGLGRIVGPHRLFRPGDIVFVLFTSFERNRCRVAAMSSKGYAVLRFFMRLSCGNAEAPGPHGPIQRVDLPDHLSGRKPDDPAVRQFVVGTLRAGDAACSGRRA